MSKRFLERAIEWEALSKPFVLEHLERVALPTPFMPGARKLTIERDRNLQLGIVADGVIADTGEIPRRREQSESIPLGAFHPLSEVSFPAYGSQLALRMHLEQVPSSLKFASRENTFRQRGWVQRVTRTSAQRFAFGSDEEIPALVPLGEPAWRSDWYVNGATIIHFTNVTKRHRPGAFKRERSFQTVDISEAPQDGGSLDHIVVETGAVRFVYARVPKRYATEKLHAVSIDYLAPFPPAETREAISEIVSFVLGRRLMRVGSTTFDGSGWAIEEESVNPWGANVRDLCRGADHPPIAYNHNGEALEKILASLVPRYLALRDELKLKDTLWSYWIAKESPASIDLPIFASAVESMKNAWLASSGSTSRGVYMTKGAFDEVSADLVSQLHTRLEASATKAKETGEPGLQSQQIKDIVKNFSGAYRMGGSAQMRAFFQEIGVPIGKREKAAIDARHRSAHGGGAEELTELVRCGNAYRTLFDRVFLRLLGYDGHYVDRTTDGHPLRQVREPAGGA